jgi:hypothetical protein
MRNLFRRLVMFLHETLALNTRRVVILILIIGFLVFLSVLPPVPTLSVVHAKSAQVTLKVAVPEIVRFRLAGYVLRSEGQLGAIRGPAAGTTQARVAEQRQGLCLGGFIEPTSGTRMIIRRTASDKVRILLDRNDNRPAAQFRGQAQEVPAKILSANWLSIEQSENCPGTPTQRFQISGVAEVGDELRPENSLEEDSSAPLLDGRVEIYGKTFNGRFDFLGREVDLGRLLSDARSRLYPVTELSLPPGSRVLEAPGPGGEAAPGNVWSGLVYVEKDETALRVELTTEAQTLQVLRPGVGIEPEILEITMFARLTNDPAILAIQAVLAFVIGIIQLLGGWTIERKREGEEA